jgi:Arc/MetJ-type ribon-helix-helix transcriptional regulator
MKVSVSIPDDDLAFLESQIAEGRFPNRSAAIHGAIRSLRTRHLESQYAEAAKDWRESGEEGAWEVTLADGVDDSAW